MATVEKTLLNSRQIAERLGTTQRRVQEMYRAGKLPAAVRLGNLVKADRAKLEEWIDAGGDPPVKRGGGSG